MKIENKKIFFKPEQHGGMLLELMLAVALAAIIIPFVFRYQKNVVERARNIAIVKQMGIVRDALENCIFENRPKILIQGISVFTEDNTPNDIDCLTLSGLTKYGLTPEFANDFGKDYKLRILKSSDYTDQPVLQGVVLLADQDINVLRTREIVKLGGDKIGFIDGENIQGGYNTFKTDKKNFEMSNIDDGIVQTTDTMRGYSKYLWRVPSDVEEDATMLSDLNLDGHDIVGLNGVYANVANFSSTLQVGIDPKDTKTYIRTTSLEFPNFSTVLATFLGDTANVYGDLIAVGALSSLNISGSSSKLQIRGDSNFNVCDAKKFSVRKDLTLSAVNADSKQLTVKQNMIVKKIGQSAVVGAMSVGEKQYVFTPRLVTKEIRPLKDDKHEFYWVSDGKNQTISLKDAELFGTDRSGGLFVQLRGFINTEGEYFTNNYGGNRANDLYRFYADENFSSERIRTLADVLYALKNTKIMVDRKYSLIEVCSLSNYADEKIKRYCVNDGEPYLPLNSGNCDSQCLDDYIAVMTTCEAFYAISPTPGSGFSQSEFFTDRYNSVYVADNFLMCWPCKNYVGQKDKNGNRLTRICTKCAEDIADNPKLYGGNLEACVNDRSTHPK